MTVSDTLINLATHEVAPDRVEAVMRAHAMVDARPDELALFHFRDWRLHVRYDGKSVDVDEGPAQKGRLSELWDWDPAMLLIDAPTLSSADLQAIVPAAIMAGFGIHLVAAKGEAAEVELFQSLTDDAQPGWWQRPRSLVGRSGIS
jgi:hypothetical protein